MKKFNREKQTRFSLRKMTIGVCSVAIGLFFAGQHQQNTVEAATVQTSTVQVVSQQSVTPTTAQTETEKTTQDSNKVTIPNDATKNQAVQSTKQVTDSPNNQAISTSKQVEKSTQNNNTSVGKNSENDKAGTTTGTKVDNKPTDTTTSQTNDTKPTYKNEWANENGNTYYYDNNGQKVVDQWHDFTTGTFYLGSNGHTVKNEWYTLPSKQTYYFDNDGHTVKNRWFTMPSKQTYYFENNGHTVKNRWFTMPNGQTYYFENNGHTVRNRWYNFSTGTYYVANDGHTVKNQWYTMPNGQTYYFENNGHTVRNRVYTLNGATYYFDNNGHTYRLSNTPMSMAQYNANAKADYTSQYNPVFAPWGCASSALSMLMKYDGNWKNVPGSTDAQKLKYMQDHLPQNYYGGQIGNPYTGAGFKSVINAQSLTAYAHQLGDSRINDISGVSLTNIAKLVESGHPVLYYGWSSYDGGGNKARNHCKVIFGYNASNNTFLVDDPLYQYKHFYKGGGGEREGIYNGYDLGPISWVSASSISREFRGNALTIK